MKTDLRSRMFGAVGAVTVQLLVVAVVMWHSQAGGRPASGHRDRESIATFTAYNVREETAAAAADHKAVRVAQVLPADPGRDQAEHGPALATNEPVSHSQSRTAVQGGIGPSVVQDRSGQDVVLYQHVLLVHIDRHKTYPDRARRERSEGIVILRFALDRHGQVLDAWVDRSSGFTSLDSEAIAAIWRAQPLPSIPSSLPDRLSIVLPVTFQL